MSEEYELYYLVDQNGELDGDKQSIAYFETEEEAHARAALDNILHYSVELESGTFSKIVFIV